MKIESQKVNEPICPDCKCELQEILFTEEEYDSHFIPTGRVRTAVSYLICPYCLRRFTVDDDYGASPWRYRK